MVAAAVKPVPVSIATVIAALRQAGREAGYTLSDTLLSLMIGQLRGAEGAYPGVGGSLGGTNNYGATQVSKSLYESKQGKAGWGGLAHYDSDPNLGGYLGWYYIAPSPLEGAREWFGGNWWGPALAKAEPQTPTEYATILYQGRYFGGMHPGDPEHDPNSEAGQANIADYASAIARGVASSAELSEAPGDPAAVTVDPSQIESLEARKITEALFNKAKSGGMGSAWGYLLPATWADLQASNGIVWFGPPPGGIASKIPWKSAVALGAVGALAGGPVGLAAGVAVAIGHSLLAPHLPALPALSFTIRRPSLPAMNLSSKVQWLRSKL